MKYLKLFEERKSAFTGDNIPKYDVDDYVECVSGILPLGDGEILLITDIDIVKDVFIQYEGIPMGEWKNFPVDKSGNYQFTYIPEIYIKRKLTEEEAEFYLNSNKYNL